MENINIYKGLIEKSIVALKQNKMSSRPSTAFVSFAAFVAYGVIGALAEPEEVTRGCLVQYNMNYFQTGSNTYSVERG